MLTPQSLLMAYRLSTLGRFLPLCQQYTACGLSSLRYCCKAENAVPLFLPQAADIRAGRGEVDDGTGTSLHAYPPSRAAPIAQQIRLGDEL